MTLGVYSRTEDLYCEANPFRDATTEILTTGLENLLLDLQHFGSHLKLLPIRSAYGRLTVAP